MKKKVIACLAMVLCILLVAGACGGDGGGAQTRLIMATGGTGGTYYPFGGVMAGVINNTTDLQISPNASGASVDNLRQIAAGDAHIALAQNDASYYAFTATEIWSEFDAVTSLRSLMALHPEPVQIVVLADSGIYSVEDLAGRRVSVGDIGSGVEANSKQILGVYGITFDDINVFNLGVGPSADAMRDGSIDAFFFTAIAPTAAIMELSTRHDVRLLSISDARIDMLTSQYAFYARATLDSENYTFLTEPVQTVTVHAQLIVSEDMDEDLVYTIVQAIMDGREEIIEGHRAGNYIDPAHAVEYISVPLHPGAIRFFQEAGVLD
ncbi:MAG: TAXI family TRAP transporter solute-binding subunit [Oscillospiraceae bacterium]|nr:TAXI family TRAP transporter solute-binding subunit [Oscillospiraceae bacterium]